MTIQPQFKPILDPGFVPAALWNRAFSQKVKNLSEPVTLEVAITRNDDSVHRWATQILPHTAENAADNLKHVERAIKFLLWQKGGHTVMIKGSPELAQEIQALYCQGGKREFDWNFIGEKIYNQPIKVIAADDLPAASEGSMELGRHLNGNRIGFDLGGSDRKCAAVIDGEVVFSTEIPWDPYFQNDPEYHINGIQDSLQKAAEHLPQVDAIGGSSAGVYVNNEVRAASLFRGVSDADFEKYIRRIFFDLKERWGNIPFEVVNDGEVTALAGAMGMEDDAVLGVAMGTSEAVGYVDPHGHIKPWLNELAFAPIDYRDDAPVDEWSGDVGCGVQYFSQQAVARLAPAAGFDFADMPFPEQLIEVQKAMKNGDENARKIYQTIGVYFGYAIAHYSDFYEIRNLLVLGRVTSGEGGEIIIEKAREVLAAEFPELDVKLVVPDEKTKRHGQAVAAASLAEI